MCLPNFTKILCLRHYGRLRKSLKKHHCIFLSQADTVVLSPCVLFALGWQLISSVNSTLSFRTTSKNFTLSAWSAAFVSFASPQTSTQTSWKHTPKSCSCLERFAQASLPVSSLSRQSSSGWFVGRSCSAVSRSQPLEALLSATALPPASMMDSASKAPSVTKTGSSPGV